MPQKLGEIENRADADRSPGNSDEQQGPGEVGRQAEHNVGPAMNDVDDGNCPLITGETERTSDPVRDHATNNQTHTRAPPYHSDSSRTAMEDVFTKEAEQDLCRASSRCPSHRDQPDA